MNTSSEYTFPIFISSTDYDLKDLRAELAHYLDRSGYKPILSSAEGFPDNSPNLEPWESCLPVLEHSFVMILIIDGRYGVPLGWPNFSEFFEGREVSPTHGEYLFAHSLKKRMLVFIRKELMAYYQSYRTVLKREKEKEKDAEKLSEKVRSILEPTLPDHVEFKTLEFIAEVKTKKPIPWIMEFDDITDVKTKVQKKMLNELAELFLIKSLRFETVIGAINNILDGMSEEEKENALRKINATKNLPDFKIRIEALEKELAESNKVLGDTKAMKKAERIKLEKNIASLNEQIESLKKEKSKYSSGAFYFSEGKLKLGGSTAYDTSLNIGSASSININDFIQTSYINKCGECGKIENNLSGTAFLLDQYNVCPGCKRNLCSTCWPKHGYLTNSKVTTLTLGSDSYNYCPKCQEENKPIH